MVSFTGTFRGSFRGTFYRVKFFFYWVILLFYRDIL